MKKMNKKGYAYGSMVRKPMYDGGQLKAPPNPGAAALPKDVRNKMGFMAYGGKMKKGR